MKNLNRRSVLILLALTGTVSFYAQAQSQQEKTRKLVNATFQAGDLKVNPSKSSSQNDFDFYEGEWQVTHQKLKTMPNGGTEWIEFQGRLDDKKMLHGIGHRDNAQSHIDGQTFQSVGIKLFDLKTKLWSLYSVNSQTGTLNYKNPLVGSFEGNIGTFYSQKSLDGKSVIIMERWDKSNPDKITRIRSISDDNGHTWSKISDVNLSRTVPNREEQLEKFLTINRALPIPALKFDENGELIIKPSSTSSNDDFDLLTGKWKMYHKKLKSRFTNSTEWIEMETTDENYGTFLNGLDNSDLLAGTFDGAHFEGYTIRLFDPKTKLWSLYWVASNTGVFDPPVVGSFVNGVGHFFCKDIIKGREVIVLFRWDLRDREHPIWSQAFSPDNGKTWEWNWINVSYKIQ